MQNESDPFGSEGRARVCVCVCLDMFCVFVPACARVDAYIIYTADTASRTEER